MKNQRPKVIIDTNLWISYLPSGELVSLDKIVSNHKIELIFCKELWEELLEVTQRPKFRKYFPIKEVDLLVQKLEARSTTIRIVSEINDCRDSKDNFLLALAKDSESDYLVTGDKDLLVHHPYGNTRILTFAQFIKEVPTP